MRTLAFMEQMLAAGRVKALHSSGRLWQIKRSGKTQTWKTRPNDFRIPIKIGFKSYGAITQDNINSPELVILEDGQ